MKTITARRCSMKELTLALESISKAYPEKMWVLDDEPAHGDAWYFPTWDAYCVVTGGMRTISVHTVFRNPACPTRGFASALVRVLPQLYPGRKEIRLDCFAGPAKAWARAGMEVLDIVAFDPAKAPQLWRAEYGEPDVLYMRMEI